MDLDCCHIVGCGTLGRAIAYSLMKETLFDTLFLTDADSGRCECAAADLRAATAHSGIRCGMPERKDISVLTIMTTESVFRLGETRTAALLGKIRRCERTLSAIGKCTDKEILLIADTDSDIIADYAVHAGYGDKNQVFGVGTLPDTLMLRAETDMRFAIGEDRERIHVIGTSNTVFPIVEKENGDIPTDIKLPEKAESVWQTIRNASRSRSVSGRLYTYAAAVAEIAACIRYDRKKSLPVASSSDGRYGMTDICVSLPTIIGKNGIEAASDITLSDAAYEKLFASAEEWRLTRDTVKKTAL